MTLKGIPIIPTIIVVAAAATMVALGFWQIGRAEEKATLIALYETALTNGEPRPFPGGLGGAASDEDLFHPTVFECTDILSRTAIAGRSARGQTGYAHIVQCETGRGPADVVLGWSLETSFANYSGGMVDGLIVRGGAQGARVLLNEPPEGLEPLARPDPNDLPNNHIAYAGQWFFFAVTALAIYFLALRSRSARRGEPK